MRAAALTLTLTLIATSLGCTMARAVPEDHLASPEAASEGPGATTTRASQPAKDEPATSKPDPPLDTSQMSPKISHSLGQDGGVLLLWPRIIPASDDPAIRSLASSLQGRMNAIIVRASGDRPLDVRPEPERVCPQAGCKATSAGVLLIHHGKGCAAVALIGEPGRSPIKLVPWGGFVTLKSPEVEFRDFPESHVTVGDFAPCDKLIDALFANEAAVEQALRDALK